MGNMNYRRAAEILGGELPPGYSWHLVEKGGQHPKMYIKSGDRERFVVLSRTNSYDHGNTLAMTRQQIKENCLDQLPLPPAPEEPKSNGHAGSATASKEETLRSYPVKAYVAGNGVLCINVPREVVPEDARATPFLTTTAKHLGLIFGKDGVAPTSTRGEGIVCFRYKRGDVTFDYSQTPVQGKSEFARLRGMSLVFNEPVSPELLGTMPKPGDNDKFTLEDGSKILARLNTWIDWAAEQHDIDLIVEDGEVIIELTETIKRRL